MGKVRGTLFPSDKEIELYRKRFIEGAGLNGRSGLLYEVESSEVVNTDVYYNYKVPVTVSYYLIDNPKRNLLLKYGWFTDDSNRSVPLVCYLTYMSDDKKDINPTEGSILEISGRVNPHQKEYVSKKFIMVDVQTDFEMNMFVCNLAPYRERIKPVNPLPTPEDPTNENRFFNRKLLGEDDLIDNNEL